MFASQVQLFSPTVTVCSHNFASPWATQTTHNNILNNNILNNDILNNDILNNNILDNNILQATKTKYVPIINARFMARPVKQHARYWLMAMEGARVFPPLLQTTTIHFGPNYHH